MPADAKPAPDWFHLGVIARPYYDPPGFGQHVYDSLGKLLIAKARTHIIGIHFPWAEPISHPVTGGAAEGCWHASGFAIDRMNGDTGLIRCWLRIAATSEALVVFGTPMPAMQVVLDVCGRIGCRVRFVK